MTELSMSKRTTRPISRKLATLADDEIEMIGGGANCYTRTCVRDSNGNIIRCGPSTIDQC